MSSKKRALPRGSTVVCLDAMILIGYAEAGLVETLGLFFDRVGVEAYTSAWLYENEIKIPAVKYPNSNRILNASWLKTAPVVDEDVLYVQNLLDAWGSDAGRDRGEAEVVALCTRYGWTGVSDDTKAHGVPELHAHYRPFQPRMVHGATLLAAATAESMISEGEAWAAHQAVESSYDDPPVLPIEDDYQPAFADAVTAIRKKRDQIGSPDWPKLLANELDPVVRAAVRKRRKELAG
jgi:hypothetical protein